MPVYEYECLRCRTREERVVAVSLRDMQVCSAPGLGHTLRRVLTTPATVHVQIAKGSYDTRVRNPTGRVLK